VTVLISLVSFLIVFSLMVFVHEFGHFWVSKRAGVHVREFGFGFPLGADKPPSERPLAWKVAEDKGGTVYTVNLIPFGGFVNLGENDPTDPQSLANFPKRVRLAALLAGPAMNLLLAVVVFALAALVGYPEFVFGVGVGDVVQGSPAEEAGLEPGDIVLRVGDLSFEQFTTDGTEANNNVTRMVEYVAPRAGQETAVVVQRGLGADALRLEFAVVPRADENGDGKMGVAIQAVPVRLNRVNPGLFKAILYGLREVGSTILMTAMVPIQVLRGLLPAGAARTVGPMGIAQLTGNAVQQSLSVDWAYPILHLTGVLNVAIGITNLLPLPAFDGGRIVFILIEAIRGKPIAPEKEGLVHGIGLMVLLLLMVAITVQDILVPLPQSFNWADYLY
jgi:regulator of sigma E protease